MSSTVLWLALLSLAAAFATTPLVRWSAWRLGAVDVPNARSSHEMATPRGGGVAILAGVATGLLVSPMPVPTGLFPILAGVGAIALISFVDDVRSLPASLRLGAQIVVASIVVLQGVLVRDLASPLAQLDMSSWTLAFFVTVFWTVGTTNAYNFMDGINGIASVQAIVAGGALAFLLGRQGDPAGALLALVLAAAAAGFLPWNYPKARVFMGDVGSAPIGFLLAMLAVRLSALGGSLLEGALPLLPFLVDTSLTLGRRILRRESWWLPHRTHLYQKLVQGGWSHAAVTALWGCLAAASAAVALSLRRLEFDTAVFALGALVAVHVAVAMAILSTEDRTEVAP